MDNDSKKNEQLKLPVELKGGLLSNMGPALSGADLHVMLVDHDVFKSVRPMLGKIIDTKGIWKSLNY